MWPSSTPAACSAAPTARLRSPGTSERSMSAASGVGRAVAALRLAVGRDDALDQLVADDVLAAEADELDVLDPGEDVPHLNQAGGCPSLQVDLGDVAGDDEPRAEPEPGEEHLHLLGARVLRFVENYERVVQRPASHEGQRRDLDRAALEVGVDLLRVEHVVQSVEERTQIGIDLRLDVPGEKAESLPCLDGRPGENHPADVPAGERGGRHGDGEGGLARAGGPDPEGDRVLPDRVDVALLVDGLRRDPRIAVLPDDVLV